MYRFSGSICICSGLCTYRKVVTGHGPHLFVRSTLDDVSENPLIGKVIDCACRPPIPPRVPIPPVLHSHNTAHLSSVLINPPLLFRFKVTHH